MTSPLQKIIGIIRTLYYGVWLRPVECTVRVREVGGSNPLTPTKASNTRKDSQPEGVFCL
jgi:hypothetical protein